MIRHLAKCSAAFFTKNRVLLLFYGLLSFCLLTTVGCEKKETPAFRQVSVGGPAPNPQTGGSIQGKVRYAGSFPTAKTIDMTADPGCQGTNASETIVGNDGGLANVFVYLKDGDLSKLNNLVFAPAEKPIIVAQEGCRYRPHVIGAMVGQTVEFFNADPATHNIHASGKSNQQWNESQPPNASVLEKQFANPEIMLPVKCNQHPWMRMYVNVVSHPFFAVSDEQGLYQIGGLPPGTYTLAFVHEKLGEQDVPVTIAPRENKTVDRTFKLP